MEGLEVFSIYLEVFGYSRFNKVSGKDYYRYADFELSSKKNEATRATFNNAANKLGKQIKVILLSKKSTAGITLANVRQVHILEPYWHETQIEQAIGRAIRNCSHKDLPLKDRDVKIYRYIVKQPSLKATADELLHELSAKKQSIVQDFRVAMEEASIDCMLNKNQNFKQGEKPRCFIFDIESNFSNISQAYVKDIQNDVVFDKGMYADETKTQTVYAIQASIQVGTAKYLRSTKYWYDPETMLIFDYELHFIVGKAKKEKDGLPTQLQAAVFVIENRVNVPLIG